MKTFTISFHTASGALAMRQFYENHGYRFIEFKVVNDRFLLVFEGKDEDDTMINETPDLRWFEKFSLCYVCKKPAAGILRGVRNESYGYHCEKCADTRLRNSKLAQEQERRFLAMQP